MDHLPEMDLSAVCVLELIWLLIYSSYIVMLQLIASSSFSLILVEFSIHFLWHLMFEVVNLNAPVNPFQLKVPATPMRSPKSVRYRSSRSDRDDPGSERRDYRDRSERDDRSSERRDYRDRYERDNHSSERSDYRDNNRRERQRHRNDGKEQYNERESRDRYERDYGGEHGRKRGRYESSRRGPGM